MLRHALERGGSHEEHALLMCNHHKLGALRELKCLANIGRNDDLPFFTDGRHADERCFFFVRFRHVGNILHPLPRGVNTKPLARNARGVVNGQTLKFKIPVGDKKTIADVLVAIAIKQPDGRLKASVEIDTPNRYIPFFVFYEEEKFADGIHT